MCQNLLISKWAKYELIMKIPIRRQLFEFILCTDKNKLINKMTALSLNLVRNNKQTRKSLYRQHKDNHHHLHPPPPKKIVVGTWVDLMPINLQPGKYCKTCLNSWYINITHVFGFGGPPLGDTSGVHNVY